MAEFISGRLQEAWGIARSSWQGEAAEAFYRQYILPMLETAGRFDAACRDSSERTQLLDRELSVIERSLSE